MSQKVLTTLSAAACVLLVGCHQEQTQVAVRFAMPPGLERYAQTPTIEAEYADANGAQDASAWDDEPTASTVDYDAVNYDAVNYDEVNALAHADRYHVTMWGAEYTGQPVTYNDLPLTPGNYTFAMWEQEPATSVQGHMQVNVPKNSLLGVYQNWKSRMPALRQQLAFAAELTDQADRDPEGFRSLQRQLSALDKLERRLDWAIWWEQRQWKQTEPQVQDFLNNAVVLVLPGDEGALTPQTRPAFCAADIETVRGGEAITKVLLVSDYDDVQAKAQVVDRLCRDLTSCKYVLREEIRRFEQRKRFLHVTDHVYRNDEAFVTNELQLQAALSAVDEINQQLTDLTTRRAALALAASFTAPDESFASLDTRHRDLLQEQAYLQAEKSRVDLLFEQAGETNLKRVDYDAARERYARALENVEEQMSWLSETRLALSQLRDSGAVLHRAGSSRVLAASVLSSDVPTVLRRVLESDAVMTVRLESEDNLFRPTNNADVAQTASYQPAQ